MRRFKRNKKGQFVIIAVLLVAIMIVSIGALLHGAITYYKHEPWEEYSTLIRDVELNSRQLLELSLVDYTQTGNPNVLNENLKSWQQDLLRMYPGSGITLESTSANGPSNIFGETLTFEQGLVRLWNQTNSFSSAKAHFTLGINSMGIDGYEFTAEMFLRLRIIGYNGTANTVTLMVYGDNSIPISNLDSSNFKVNDAAVNATSIYDPAYAAMKYVISYEGPSPPMVEVWDQRGIHVIGLP